MTDFDLRLVAYTPFGARKGPLPEPLQFTYTMSKHGYPTVTVDYAKRSPRSDWLEERVEVALEVFDGDSWREPDNCRTLRIGRSWDRVDKLQVRRYRLYGLGWLLTRLRVFDATDQDPADGPVKPTRWFNDPDPGNMMVPLVNAAFARAFPTHDDPPDKTYGLNLDSNDVSYEDKIIPGRVEFATTQPLADVERLLINCDFVTTAWSKRKYEMFLADTYGRDLSLLDPPVILRDSFGITSSPETQDDDDLAARVLITGEGGRYLVREDEDAEDEYGLLENALGSSGLHDLEAMNKSARELARLGRTTAEQLTREGHAGTAGPKPLRDFRIEDKLLLQRGDADNGVRLVKLPCVEISVTKRMGKGITWHAKFAERHENRLARAIAQNARLSAGTVPGPGGNPSDPGPDVRAPLAPTNVQVTTTAYANENQTTRGEQSVTWDAVTMALDGTPINLRGYVIGEKRYGVTSEITEVGPNVLSWTRDNVGPGARELVVKALSKQGFGSAWSDDADGTVILDDEDALYGAGLVVDSPHKNAGIRARRASQAGAGFAYVPVGSVQSARFTSTAAVHDYGVAGGTVIGQALKSGRAYCAPGDKIVVDFKAQLASGSSGSVRAAVRFWDRAGNVVNTLNAVSSEPTSGSVTTHTGSVEAPAGASSFAVRTSTPALGSGAAVYINDVHADRRTNEARMENDAISTRVLQDLAVAFQKIADRAVGGIKIRVNGITAEHITAGSIETAKLAAGAVVAGKIAAGAITSDKIVAGAITGDKISTNALNGKTMSGVTIAAAYLEAASANIPFFGSGMTIGGNTQIGTGLEPANLLVTGSITEGSMRRLKADLKPLRLEDALPVLDLPAYSYRRRGDTSAPRQVGWIAEDADGKVETLVGRDEAGELAGLNYAHATVPLAVILKHHHEEIAALKAQIEALQSGSRDTDTKP